MWSVFPLIRADPARRVREFPWEARLGREEFGREVHSFAAGLRRATSSSSLATSNHLVFNSFGQLERFRPLWQPCAQAGRVSVGLRVNPSTPRGTPPSMTPARPASRLGIRRAEFGGRSLAGVEGLHFHTLCVQLFEPLGRTAAVYRREVRASSSSG